MTPMATVIITEKILNLNCISWFLFPSSIQGKMEKLIFVLGASTSNNNKISRSRKSYNLTAEFSALVVDDDAVIRRVHKALLSRCGFETLEVENGQEAVDEYYSGKRFDLVLMDMEMPIKDGPKATRELRAMGVDSTIVGVTSRGLDSEKQAFIAAGLNACYEKPITADTITSILQVLRERN